MDKNLVVTNRVFKQAVLDLIGSDEVLPIMDNDDDILTSEIFKQYMTLVPTPGSGGPAIPDGTNDGDIIYWLENQYVSGPITDIINAGQIINSLPNMEQEGF